MTEDEKLKELLSRAQKQIQKQSNDLQESAEINSLLIQELENTNKELTTWKRIKESDKWYSIAQAAKLLSIPIGRNKIMGRNLLYGFLRDSGILIYDKEPKQEYIDKHYFDYQLVYIDYIDEEKPVLRVSIKGIDFIRKVYEGEIIL